jgi:hypothetical protein
MDQVLLQQKIKAMLYDRESDLLATIIVQAERIAELERKLAATEPAMQAAAQARVDGKSPAFVYEERPNGRRRRRPDDVITGEPHAPVPEA